MKAEKIEKHMLRRTVVVGEAKNIGAYAVGVITQHATPGVRLAGAGNEAGKPQLTKDFNWFDPSQLRKATDAERAEFFAWLVSDGRDIADGFQRVGGMPRGFEAWRAAQAPAAEPTPKPTAFVVGQRVRIVKGGGDTCLRGFVDGDVCEVVDPDTGGEHSILVTRDGLRGYARPDQLELIADEPEPAAPTHKVGDLRVGLDHDGLAIVGRVRRIDLDGDIWIGGACCRPGARTMFEPTPENVARLAEQQRECGVEPELGDLVFVLINRDVVATALVAHNVSTAPDAKLLQGVMVGGGAFSWGFAPDLVAHTLVIRRCPFRGVEDV